MNCRTRYASAYAHHFTYTYFFGAFGTARCIGHVIVWATSTKMAMIKQPDVYKASGEWLRHFREWNTATIWSWGVKRIHFYGRKPVNKMPDLIIEESSFGSTWFQQYKCWNGITFPAIVLPIPAVITQGTRYSELNVGITWQVFHYTGYSKDGITVNPDLTSHGIGLIKSLRGSFRDPLRPRVTSAVVGSPATNGKSKDAQKAAIGDYTLCLQVFVAWAKSKAPPVGTGKPSTFPERRIA